MLKQMLMMTVAVATLGLGATTIAQAPEPATAQSVYQTVPKAYRGTWQLKHATWAAKKNLKLEISAHAFKSQFGTYAGQNLGVEQGKHNIAVFQMTNGMQVGPYNTLQRVHYQNQAAIKWSFNGQSMTYVRVK